MLNITVTRKNNAYPIHIGAGLIEHGELLKPLICGSQVLIVTQKTIPNHFLSTLQKQLAEYQCDVLFLPIGEAFKTLAEWQKIIDILLENHHQRTTTLIALGGGMVGDMTGFAAACYQRGVNYIQIPTTLIALVDSAVGGKTGVNHPAGKNMIGAFYQPIAVIADVLTLKSLPRNEFVAGIAEVIKYGLICDAELFAWLTNHVDVVLQKDLAALQYIIQRCLTLKAEIVSRDERDQSLRNILNFGHTLGHALETAFAYQNILHGEAIAIGMLAAAKLSSQRGFLTLVEVDQIEQVLKKYGLLANRWELPEMRRLFSLMRQDKKSVGDQLSFILLKKIGEAVRVDDVVAEEWFGLNIM